MADFQQRRGGGAEGNRTPDLCSAIEVDRQMNGRKPPESSANGAERDGNKARTGVSCTGVASEMISTDDWEMSYSPSGPLVRSLYIPTGSTNTFEAEAALRAAGAGDGPGMRMLRAWHETKLSMARQAHIELRVNVALLALTSLALAVFAVVCAWSAA